MSILIKRGAAALLAASAAHVGWWALLAPRSFYATFPLPGHAWVAAEPPYSEHLVRDVGALYLALFALSVWVLLRPRAEAMAMVGLGWEVFSIPHLVFHLAHLGGLSTADAVGNVVSLGGTVVLAALLLVRGRRKSAPALGAVTA